MIKVNNLSKEFHEQGTSNELLAVDHVDFTIQNGSFCALVGESGSGKSTLAQLMCGLLVPSSGEVLFEGKNISLCRGKQKQVLRSKIQLILQDGKGAMDPRFTVLVRKHILDLLKRLHQERKMTCFFITHDLDVALYLADRVMVMRCGKIIEDRTFHGSTDCFTHPYTKLLLHSIAPYLG